MSNLILRPANFSELAAFANMAAKSRMVPAAMQNKPEDIMLAIQMGSELGLAPMQAIQNVAVINGRPAVWGDALIGLCRASKECRDIQESTEGEGDNMTAVCVAMRHGASAVTARFSVADAKKAGLWGKQGPWQQYPTRMLQLRARGFALRDAFPDVLRGIISAEEARDMPTEAAPYVGPTIEARAEPVAQASEKPRRTAGDFLAALEVELRAAETWEAVAAIVERDDVRQARDLFRNGAADRLSDMIDAAQERVMQRVEATDANV